MSALRPIPYPVLRIVMHAAALLPLVILAARHFSGSLGANPIQAATQATGDAALWLLTFSLACTPLNTVFQWRPVLRLRRPLGLYAFFYAALHMLLFVGVDYAFNLRQLGGVLLEKRFIWVGAAAFLILLALAVTSFNYWMRRLGKKWKNLHRLVYLAAVLVVVHNAWAVKGNLLTLQGDVLQPLAFGLVVHMLLILRLPPLRAWITRRRPAAQRRVIAPLPRPDNEPAQ